MADLTIAEIAAQFPAGDPLTAWWTGSDPLPANVDVNEFFVKTLKAASDAQRVKNANLPVGSRIDGYPAPTYGSIQISTTDGSQSFLVVASVRSRVAANLDVAVSPLT